MTTVSGADIATDLAEKIVAAKLAACVQILPQMTSVYVWEGKLQREPEFLMLIKTLPQKYDELEAFIKANHGYSVPEIAAIESKRVSGKYSRWMRQALSENTTT